MVMIGAEACGIFYQSTVKDHSRVLQGIMPASNKSLNFVDFKTAASVRSL
jgi:hypothetical protein